MDFLYKKLIVFSLMMISFSLQAICITNKTRIDTDCNCKKNNSCLKYNSKNLKRQMSNSTKVSGKKVKKVYSKVMPAYNGADSLFNGTVNSKDIDIEKFKKVDKQFSKLNTKMIKSLEKQYKASGSKQHSFSTLKKYVGKIVNKAIPQNIRNYVERNGISVSAISKVYGISSKSLGEKFGSSAESSIAAIKNISEGIPPGEKIESIQLNKRLTDEEIAKRQAADALRSGKKYKINDIHPVHKDIWRVISVRYSSLQNRLDQRAILADDLRINKIGVKRQFYNLIDKMN